jgi:hypothetical protein
MGTTGVARGPYDKKGKGGRKDREGTAPTRDEQYRWALSKLEETIDRLEKYPHDRVMVLAVIRRKKELVEARERLGLRLTKGRGG